MAQFSRAWADGGEEDRSTGKAGLEAMKLADILRSRAQGSVLQVGAEAEVDANGQSWSHSLPVAGEVRLVPVSSILPGPFALRGEEEESGLDELVASIRAHGVLQPIVVRPKEDRFELILGRRRWEACRRLGKEAIPALVREVSDEEAAQWVLVENLQRRDPDPLAEARALKAFMESTGVSLAALAERLGCKAERLAWKVRLLELPEFVQGLVSSGKLREEHARALLDLEDPLDQVSLAVWAVKHQATSAQLARRVRRAGKRQLRRGRVALRGARGGSKR